MGWEEWINQIEWIQSIDWKDTIDRLDYRKWLNKIDGRIRLWISKYNKKNL